MKKTILSTVTPLRILSVLTTALIGVLFSSAAQAGMIGPIIPYYGIAQSPFNGLPFTYFHLETFEEAGAPTAPGVTASAGVVYTGALGDSVEGPGPLGHSFFSGCGSCGITFTFNAAALGGHLPTNVGIVWTDGDAPNRTFKAYDASNALIGTIIDSTQKFYSTGGDNLPSNYRFFGATNPAGISSIFIANTSGGIEVDDLQYGYLAPAVPEPGEWALMLSGLGLMGFIAARSQKTTKAA